MSSSRELVERREEEGGVIELWRRGDQYDVVVEERTIMSTDVRRSEQSLSELALAPWEGRDDVTVLVAGLGMGFLARAFLGSPAVARVDVVEASAAIIEWEEKYFAGARGSVTKDSRVHVHHSDLVAFLRGPRTALPAWLVTAVDTDDWPFALSRAENQWLYSDEGLALLEGSLRPGGVIALWATQRDDELFKRVWARFQNVIKVAVPVEIRGHASLDYVYRGRRGAQAVTTGEGEGRVMN